MLPGRWYLLILLLLIVFLVTLIQVGVITIAFEKLGLSPSAAMAILFGSLFGSAINIPIYQQDRTRPSVDLSDFFGGGPWRIPRQPFSGGVVIAVNLGGCIIPIGVSLFLVTHHDLSVFTALLGISVVSLVSYKTSRLIPGIGIGMPLLLAPLVSAVTALLIDPANSAPLAYISGTMGVLIGADLLHLKEIVKINVPIASIGGAGTFDGIFITGIVAALLA